MSESENTENTTEQVPSAGQSAENMQGSGTQAPANVAPPPEGGATYNSEAGWSGGNPADTANPAPGERIGEPQAAKTEPDSVHTLRGMQIGTPVVDQNGNPVVGSGMIAGGAIVKEHMPPAPEPSPTAMLQEWTRRAVRSPHFSLLGALAGRPISEWGLFGKGTTVRGLTIGINLETLEKELFHDGHVIEHDGVWANARNFPEFVTAGDNLQAAAGER